MAKNDHLSISIRLQTNPKPETILALDRVCFPSDDEPDVDGRLWWYASKKNHHRPVAYAAMRIIDSNTTGYLYRAGVIPAYRSRGLHKRLIRARLAYAKRIGLQAVVTYVSAYNHTSLNGLVGRGFRVYDPENAWAGRDEVVYLKLELDS